MISIIDLADLKGDKKEYGTFNDLLIQLNELRKTDEYKKVRQIVTAKNEIENKEAKLSNWKYDQQLFYLLCRNLISYPFLLE